ncbi:hypothetical protein CDL12_04769 [Handroanthus impetiginosus]|uniref:Uncharacterized protein n=1 Tax=Handroanthus impetiginosus TaxID=429701 RepID=A0A2G9HYD2_9LAMI|nr:hypothetical protein CDL12_04769 [Handroanthus impetiginosus]
MEQFGCNSRSTSRTAKSRRRKHPSIFKTLRVEGCRCDGTFRGGYMIRLQSIMAGKSPTTGKFPMAGILVKHIKSKLQVWKRTYGHVLEILGSSGGVGACLDPFTNMIVAESDSIFIPNYTNNYQTTIICVIGCMMQVHRGATQLKGKSLPRFNSWVEIFGNDKTHGRGAVDFGDVVHNLIKESASKDTMQHIDTSFGQNSSPHAPNNDDDPLEDATSNTPPPVAQQAPNKSSSADNFEDIMGKFIKSTSPTFGHIADKLAQSPPWDADILERLVALFEALADILNLTLEQQINATHLLALNKEEMNMFWGVYKEAHSKFVQMLLLGTYGRLEDSVLE